jgi:sn-glycerol 3-phosphate transport system substrate-binding protein
MTAAAILAALTLTTACNSGDNSGDNPSNSDDASNAGDFDGTISFWYAMAGRNGEAIMELVDRYNAQNENGVQVEAIYQGNYNDTLTKLRASAQSGDLPSMVQVNELSTRFMYDSGLATPVQELAGQAGYSFDDLNQKLVDYYTVDGVVQSMPFNVSAPTLYYNKDAFAEAGLDPDDPPQTLDDIRTAAEELSGGSTEYGFVASIDGYLIEQYLAMADAPYCDAGNGRDGLATQVEWDNDVTEHIIGWWTGMVEDDLAINVGRNNNNASAAFQSGNAAMMTFTSANLRDIVDGSEFEVGLAPFPKPREGDTGGPLLGGGSLWALDGQPDEAKEAVFDFMAFMMSPESQAVWSTSTGYVPVNERATELPEYTDVLAEYPDLALAGEQLAATPEGANTTGCLMGVMPQARDRMNDAVEAALLGVKEPRQALQEAAASLTSAIEQYNDSVTTN